MGRKKSKNRAELLAENQILRRVNRSDSITKIALGVIQYGAFVLIARYVYKAIKVTAGKITAADYKVTLDTGASLCESLVWTIILTVLFGLGGIAYGLAQRRLRGRVIEKLQPYQEKYEKTKG